MKFDLENQNFKMSEFQIETQIQDKRDFQVPVNSASSQTVSEEVEGRLRNTSCHVSKLPKGVTRVI